MKPVIVMMTMLTLQGCSALGPDFYKTVDDIGTDGTVQIQIDKEAFEKETNTYIVIDINNRDAVNK